MKKARAIRSSRSKTSVGRSEAETDIPGPETMSGKSILNSLNSNIAVLAADGTILFTNDAWNDFARDNGNPPLRAIGPGVNYLEVCHRAAEAQDSDAKFVAAGIQSVLDRSGNSFD